MISNQLIQLDWQKFIREKYPNKDQQCSTNPTCVSIKYRTNEHSSTHISYQLFSQAKPIVNRYPSESQSLSISDCVDWTNHQSKTSSFENFDRIDGIYSSASMNNNNNHLHLPTMFNTNLQSSNHKEKKKNKKEKTNENDDDKTKKSKVKIIEETGTDFESTPISPVKNNFDDSKPSPTSPVQSISIPTLSIPVPQIGGSFSPTLTSPDLSRSPSPQPSNIAHLSQIQRQLQIDSPDSYPMSIQQQLQSFAQMANDGEEILITLNINALTQKQRMNNNSTPYPYPGMSPSNQMTIPRNLEIAAKGFARIPHERSYSQQPPVLLQQPSTFFSPSSVPRSSVPYCSNTALPQRPLGPPIQPIILPSNPAEFTSSRRNYFDNDQFRSSARAAECYHQCQLSLYKPDFCNRPFPGITKNPYLPPSLDPVQFSSKYYSERKYSLNANDEYINRI